MEKSVTMNRNVTLLVVGMVFVFFGAFLKITEISTAIVHNSLITTGIIIEIIAVYFIFRYLKKKQ